MQKEWKRKAKLILRNNGTEELDFPAIFAEKAGVYSEFAKVVCIGVGAMYHDGSQWKIKLKSLTGDDERQLLEEFNTLITKFIERQKDLRFVGHNIKEFDLPFLARRMVINRLPVPNCLNTSGKKPWEVTHIDTMDLWRFGDYKNYTSLSLLAEVFGIPSPKDDLDGSMVAGVYWNDHDLPRIAKYCLQDVHTSARVYLRLAGIYDIEPIPVYEN
jgi:DNA polymerase elongation subunit (family B)